MNEFTDKGVYGDHALGFELAERHVNRPLIGPGGAKAVVGQIGALTDAHAGVANQQKDIATQIVAAEEFLLQELVLLCGEWAWQSLREARNVLPTDEMSQLGKLLGPRQFVQDGAQSDKPEDIRCGRQRRHLRAQAAHPAEDVGLTAQLIEAIHLGVIGAEIAEEVARSPMVVTDGCGAERSAERIHSAGEERSERMLEWGAARAIHEEVLGTGRMCCATARAY